jgi:AraC family transcriptional regulator
MDGKCSGEAEGEVSLEEIKPQIVLGIRRKGAYKEIPEMLKALFAYAKEKGITLSGAPVFVCHEKDLDEACMADKAGLADLEACFPVAKRARGKGEISCYTLEGASMAKIVHKGPYEECGPSYQKLFDYAATSGRKISGPIREVYLNDPMEVKPDEILTEICLPVK